jgi:hypothetical protein
MARILRPGGGVALFWNVPDVPRSEFLAEEVQLLGRYLPQEHVEQYDEEDHEPPEVIGESDKFACDDWVEFTHERTISADGFVALTFTASQVNLFVPDERKDELRSELRALMAEHFGDDPVVLPYKTSLFVAERNEVPA